jgi:hypothetical protein
MFSKFKRTEGDDAPSEPPGMPEHEPAHALPAKDGGSDLSQLAQHLSALAYPARLELMGILRFPRLVSEIRLAPQRVAPGENRDRPSAKPTVQAHLDKLVESDFLRVEDVGSGGRKVFRYSVNANKFYALVEDLRRLNTIYAGRGGGSEETGTLAHSSVSPAATGPRLVLVHGVYEGKTYSFDKLEPVEGRWLIGRQRSAAVSLDYDGYVSSEHAAITTSGGRFYVRDLNSKNGTFVNWKPVPPGGAVALQPADVVGVGRSLLVFGS